MSDLKDSHLYMSLENNTNRYDYPNQLLPFPPMQQQQTFGSLTNPAMFPGQSHGPAFMQPSEQSQIPIQANPNQIFFVSQSPANLAMNKKEEVHFDLAITMSVFVCIFFNFLFGCIAFIIAIEGVSRKSGHNKGCLQRASYIISLVGLIVAIFIWLVVLSIYMASNSSRTYLG